MRLVFSSIINGTIFEPEFQALTPANGTIEFKHMNAPGGIAVVYAPNGTGKSSIAKVLDAETTMTSISFSATDDAGITLEPESHKFHIIFDQINRNIIPGKETDYLIGQQIKHEYELRDRINAAFVEAFTALSAKYKSDFKVSKVGDFLLAQINKLRTESYQKSYEYIRSIINTRTHGRNIEQSDFISFIRNNANCPHPLELEPQKKTWLITDASNAKIVEKIISLNHNEIIANNEIIQIERHDDAITLLKKYPHLDSCIVCDNHDFNGNAILTRKVENRRRIYDSLDQNTRELLDKVVMDNSLIASDPFRIKQIISAFIADGNAAELIALQNELNFYVHAIGDEMIVALFHCFDGTRLFQDFDEYNALVATQPQLDSEELLFIEDVINENIGKDISIIRDPDSKNYKLKLGTKDLLGMDRGSMELSSGEQNFISLAFELLMARHSTKEYVVLDDPISSFDSVYKNKIAYCIIKFLENKKQIVLTHNIDLIRLLNVQLSNCFNLYILNNVEHGNNGFIPVGEYEKKLLINLHELIALFQNKNNCLVPAIRNRRQFLMSMVPFMRGYAHIAIDQNDDVFGQLSGIMHGYGTGSIDVVPIYKKLFGYDFGASEVISVDNILNINYNQLDILDLTIFPLLGNTLKQTLVYYYLRMKVEKELVASFGITTHDMDTLNQIIQRAFRCEETDPDYEQKRKFRVFFTSRKTLLNEFNHFEGNMNIFQPAIDITQAALQKEITDIESELAAVRLFAVNAIT